MKILNPEGDSLANNWQQLSKNEAEMIFI